MRRRINGVEFRSQFENAIIDGEPRNSQPPIGSFAQLGQFYFPNEFRLAEPAAHEKNCDLSGFNRPQYFFLKSNTGFKLGVIPK